MANKELVDYIKYVRAQGYEDSLIIDALNKKGWQPKDISEAFIFVASPTPPSSISSVPITDSSSLDSSVYPSFVNNDSQIAQNLERKFENNSPFSVGLAIVLTFSLFILVNKIIHDIGISFDKNVNDKLIFDAIITIPFLFVSFLLYGIAYQDRIKFIIVSQPYFIVSGFLFLRLLWDTSMYVLNTNATYGVYIVLIMAILVLTGFIIFLQRFLKS